LNEKFRGAGLLLVRLRQLQAMNLRIGHDATDRLRAMDLAQLYGRELHTGVFYRNPAPGPTYDALARERQADRGHDSPPGQR